MDGLRVLCMFQKRCGNQTSASMLQSCLEVVTPVASKEAADTVRGIYRW